MGPFSEDKQWQRCEAVRRLAEDKSLPEDTRAMWNRKLLGMALTEDEYNRRVIEIYNSPKFKLMGIKFAGSMDDV